MIARERPEREIEIKTDYAREGTTKGRSSWRSFTVVRSLAALLFLYNLKQGLLWSIEVPPNVMWMTAGMIDSTVERSWKNALEKLHGKFYWEKVIRTWVKMETSGDDVMMKFPVSSKIVKQEKAREMLNQKFYFDFWDCTMILKLIAWPNFETNPSCNHLTRICHKYLTRNFQTPK